MQRDQAATRRRPDERRAGGAAGRHQARSRPVAAKFHFPRDTAEERNRVHLGRHPGRHGPHHAPASLRPGAHAGLPLRLLQSNGHLFDRGLHLRAAHPGRAAEAQSQRHRACLALHGDLSQRPHAARSRLQAHHRARARSARQHGVLDLPFARAGDGRADATFQFADPAHPERLFCLASRPAACFPGSHVPAGRGQLDRVPGSRRRATPGTIRASRFKSSISTN